MRTNRVRIRCAAALACGLALVGAGASPVSAAPAQHDVYVEEYDASAHLTAAENFCGPWAATFREVRSGSYKILLPPGGRVEGEFHVNGAIDGRIELIPDDRTRPTYTGTYREKVNVVVVEVTDDGDVVRVGQYRLRSTLHGTDGSRLVLRLSGKVTMNSNGEVVVSHDSLSCG
jgi:hypothetical protein